MSYAPWTCEMCNGRGMVGGWRPGSGYDAVDCPDCAAVEPYTHRIILRDPTGAVPHDMVVTLGYPTQEQALADFIASRQFSWMRWSFSIFMERSDGLRRWVKRHEYSSKD